MASALVSGHMAPSSAGGAPSSGQRLGSAGLLLEQGWRGPAPFPGSPLLTKKGILSRKEDGWLAAAAGGFRGEGDTGEGIEFYSFFMRNFPVFASLL